VVHDEVPVEVTWKPKPVYTEEARRAGIEGEVVLEVLFGARGEVQILRVVRGLGHGLDEAAIEVAQKVRFKPALADGQPVDRKGVLYVLFQVS
jgi:TonB family protein